MLGKSGWWMVLVSIAEGIKVYVTGRTDVARLCWGCEIKIATNSKDGTTAR